MAKPNWKNLVKDLKGYNDSKQKAEENPQGGIPQVPNGNYDARVVAAEVRLSKNKEAMAMISLIIIGDSEEAETKLASFIMLEGNGAALDRFLRLGYDLPEDSSGLADMIDDLGNSEKEVSITVKGGFATINGLVDDPHIASEDVVEEETSEEETTEEEVEEEGEVTEEDETVDVGDDVNFEFKGKQMQGSIVSTDEKTETAKIKSGTKLYTVKLEKILGKVEEETSEEVEEEAEEEVEEEPKKKPASKKVEKVTKKVTKPAAKGKKK